VDEHVRIPQLIVIGVVKKSVLKWSKRVFIIKLFIHGMAKMDVMMEVDYNEEMK
jgi:hypothetical protein